MVNSKNRNMRKMKLRISEDGLFSRKLRTTKRIRKEQLRLFLSTSIFLLATAFLCGNMGNMDTRLSDLTALCLLFAFLLTYLPIRPADYSENKNNRSNKKNTATLSVSSAQRYLPYAATAILFIVAAIMVINMNGVPQLTAFAIFLFGFDLVLRKAGRTESELPVLLMTVTFYGIFLMLNRYVPWIWSAFQWFSLKFSGAVGWIIHREIQLGITYSGLMLVVLFAFYFISSFAMSEKKKPLNLVKVIALLLAADAVYIAIWSYLVGSSVFKHLELAQPFLSSYDFMPILFLLLLVPAFFFVGSMVAREVPVKIDKSKAPRIALALVLLLVSVLTLALQIPGSKKTKEVVFYDNNFLDWSVPGFNRLGLKNIGMFGMLPEYLKAKGYGARTENKLTEKSLENAKILVVINLNTSFDKKTQSVIWDFINNGGSLLALGDHTGQESIRKPFNNLLRPVNIEFNFDSAISIPELWPNGFELLPHPLLGGISQDEIKIGTGASLTVGFPSKPVILGGYSFSDKGNTLNPDGNLGNMKYDQGEQVGDTILAAQAFHGRGRVLAFGDTSSFQNGALPYNYKFMDNVFDWLAASGGKGAYPYSIFIAVAFLAGSLFVLFFRLKVGTASLLVYFLLLVLALSISQAASAMHVGNYGRLKAKTANIDISHIERCSMDPLSTDSIDGFEANLMRNGYIPLLLKEFKPERVRDSKILAVIAPSKPFTTAEISTIRDFVQKGGLLIVSAGWEESEAVTPLLEEFGMRVENVPLGKVVSSAQGGADLWEAWPVGLDKKDNVKVLARAWDYPVIVFSRQGKGGVLAVGDSYFFLNKNLEQIYDYNEENIFFIKGFLERLKDGW